MKRYLGTRMVDRALIQSWARWGEVPVIAPVVGLSAWSIQRRTIVACVVICLLFRTQPAVLSSLVCHIFEYRHPDLVHCSEKTVVRTGIPGRV